MALATPSLPSLPTSVLLVRHTDVHNPANIVYGRMPRFRLSVLGLVQAERTADCLGALPLTAVYASPQLRARQTAGIIARRHSGLAVRVSPLLAEVRTSWQGAPFAVLDATPDPYDPLPDPSDETPEMIFDRMNRALRQVANRHAGQTVVCVSHADPIMICRVGNLGLAFSMTNIHGPEFPTKGSITRFDFSPSEVAPRVSYLDVNGSFTALTALPADEPALAASGARP
jgi:broad specificity phosphatase PhoE